MFVCFVSLFKSLASYEKLLKSCTNRLWKVLFCYCFLLLLHCSYRIQYVVSIDWFRLLSWSGTWSVFVNYSHVLEKNVYSICRICSGSILFIFLFKSFIALLFLPAWSTTFWDVLIYPVVIDQFLLSVLLIYLIHIETVWLHLCWIRMVKSFWWIFSFHH